MVARDLNRARLRQTSIPQVRANDLVHGSCQGVKPDAKDLGPLAAIAEHERSSKELF
jgi:hypothetical protein